MSSPKISRVVPKLAKTAINTIVKRFQTKRPLPSTIQDLPDDVLDVIFEFFLILHKDLLLILHVSTRWRALALANPHLWTSISIDRRFSHDSSSKISEPSEFGGVLKFNGRYQICGDYRRFLDALRRTGSLPIQVRCEGDWNLPDDNLYLGKILRVPLSHRIEVLTLQDIDWSKFSLGDPPYQMSFPVLRELNLHAEYAEWPIHFLQSIDRRAPKLTHLRLETYLDSSLINLRILSNLQSLEVKPASTSIGSLSEIIKSCTKLVEFRSSSNNWPSYYCTLDPEMLAKLPEVHLGCDPSHLQKLNLQNLQMLHYRNFRFHYDGPHPSLTFPELATLKVQTRIPFSYIGQWKMPRLRSLSIDYQSFGLSSHERIITSFPTVTDFHMETWEYDTSLVPTFQLVPNVHRLSFIQRRERGSIRGISNFCDDLIRLGEGGVCPELQTLTLGDLENAVRPPSLTRVHETMKRILEARRKKGMTMIDFSIYLDKSGKGMIHLYRYPL